VVLASVAVLAGATLGAVASNRAASGARAADVVLGPTEASARVEATLVLRTADPGGLRRYLAALEAPRWPGGSLSPAAYGRRFGVSNASIERIRRVVTRAGLRVTASYPQRTAIRVEGPARAVERFFGVLLVDHEAGGIGRYHAPTSVPTVPSSLRPDVTSIVGLSDRPTVVSFHHLGEVPSGGLTPSEVASVYDIAPLQHAGFTGTGRTIAVISFATFKDSEVAAYDRHFGLSGPPVVHVKVDGGTTKSDLEANLDVEVIRAIAPGARILNFEAPNGNASIGDVIDAIVKDGRASVISDSWGFCVQPDNAAERSRDQRAIDAALAKGISIFAASGDAGAYDCQRTDASAITPTVDWPASSSGVIGVGGTRVFLTPTGGYEREFGWEDVLSDAGAGGGFSPDVPRPTWQQGPGVDTPASTGARQIPDVAGPADPDSGFFVVGSNDAGQPAGFQVGGTSAAAPFWAASTLLMEQYSASNGGGALGFVAPALYAIAARAQQFPAFHDVTHGANRLYPCTAGWDAATGLGSPDVFGLARDLVGRAHG
jgi:kumamolisin